MTPLLTRILHVEDQLEIQVIVRIALTKRGGFEVCVCGSGEEALAAAPAFAPDLLLLDVMMPGMDGPATLAALRHLPGTVATPAVFLTAKVALPMIDEYLALGAIDVIAKPFDPMTLADQLRAIWNLHHGSGSGPPPTITCLETLGVSGFPWHAIQNPWCEPLSGRFHH